MPRSGASSPSTSCWRKKLSLALAPPSSTKKRAPPSSGSAATQASPASLFITTKASVIWWKGNRPEFRVFRAALGLEPQKIRQQSLAGVGEDRLGVELHAFGLGLAVAQAHDEPVGRSGGNFETGRETGPLDDERVIARGGEGVWQPGENRLAVVRNQAGLAVFDLRRANNLPSERLPDGLVAEADAQQGHAPRKLFDDLQANSSLGGGLRAGRYDDALRPQPLDLFGIGLVVAPHLDLGAQLTQILDQVVGERVVVVND